jgi:DNA-binding MarR family transcriptional regulator/GNAT superfamily N-acetyltransferase
MDDLTIDRVRRFNRTVTQRVGVLNDHYLGRDRPLGEARVLWEVGPQGCDVRRLRSQLDLDSGYLSRLLRSLESAGLVTVDVNGRDRRVRTVRLTRRGTAERAVLDRRSVDLARSMVEPLTEDQREQLTSAMGKVDRLLTLASVVLEVIDPAHRDGRYCLSQYYAELGQRFAGGFDPSHTRPTEPDQMQPPAGLFLLASLRGEPVGCGALMFHGSEPTELKRMWVAREARGIGLGRRLLRELEALAARHGSRVIRLDSNGALVEAIAMYRASGYREVDAFNDEPYADHWFEKRLPLLGS